MSFSLCRSEAGPTVPRMRCEPISTRPSGSSTPRTHRTACCFRARFGRTARVPNRGQSSRAQTTGLTRSWPNGPIIWWLPRRVTRSIVARRREAPIESDEVFAVDRNRSSAAQPANGAVPSAKMPSAPRQQPGADVPVISQDPSDPQEFPIPFAVSGVMPKLPPPKNSADASAKRPAGRRNIKGGFARRLRPNPLHSPTMTMMTTTMTTTCRAGAQEKGRNRCVEGEGQAPDN